MAVIGDFAAHISCNCAFAVIGYYCSRRCAMCVDFAWDSGSSPRAVFVVTAAVAVVAASIATAGAVVADYCATCDY